MFKYYLLLTTILLVFIGCDKKDKVEHSISDIFMISTSTSTIDPSKTEQTIKAYINKSFNYESRAYTVKIEVDKENSTLNEGEDFVIENKILQYKKDEIGSRTINIVVETASVIIPQKISLKLKYDSEISPEDQRLGDYIEMVLIPIKEETPTSFLKI